MIKVKILKPVALLCSLVIATSAMAQFEPDKIPAEERAAKYRDPNWQAPRTSWGDPDLEGLYSTDDMRSVPRDRPEEFGTREKLSPEEFAERAKSDVETRDRILNHTEYSSINSSNSVGSRTFGWTSQIIDPPNGRIPEMNETGKARVRPNDRGTYGPGPFDTFEDLHLYERCITRGILGSAFAVIYGNGLRITQSPDAVVISYEMLPESRIIKLDGRPFPQDNIRQYLGSSRGHWEGDTLVVKTTNLTGKTSINAVGSRHSEKIVITERLTRVDPEMIEYIVTVEDPLTFNEPFTARMMFTTQPGYIMYEYACHEGSTAVRSALGGERRYEHDVAEAIARGEKPPERLPSQPRLDALPKDESLFIDLNKGGGAE